VDYANFDFNLIIMTLSDVQISDLEVHENDYIIYYLIDKAAFAYSSIKYLLREYNKSIYLNCHFQFGEMI